MHPVICPYCHVALDPAELEEAAAGACRYLVCPECDSPLPLRAANSENSGAGGEEDGV